MSRRPLESPNEGTGELNQSAWRARVASRNAASLGHSGQFRSGTVSAADARQVAGARSVVEIVFIAPRRHRGRALQELRSMMTRLSRSRTLGGIATELGL